MPAQPTGRGPFEIDASGVVARAFAELQQQALRAGRGGEFNLAVHSIWERLRHDPDVFGEPLYRLPAMRMMVRHSVVRPVCVDFAVSEDRPYVFIKSVKLMTLERH